MGGCAWCAAASSRPSGQRSPSTAPAVLPAFAGWVLLGLGLAATTPAIIGAAPGVADVPVPAAIAAVTTVSYLGSFTGPPLIGALARAQA